MIVSVTRLHLLKKRKLIVFLWHTFKSFRQAKRAPGIIDAAVDKEGWHTFWTMTVWNSKEDMMRYRKSGNHLRAMKVSKAISKKIDYLHWEIKKEPSFKDAKQHLKQAYDE